MIIKMKKSIVITILILALSLTGCQSSAIKVENTQPAKNITKSNNTELPKNTAENENTSSEKNTAEGENSKSAKDSAQSQNTESSTTITDDTTKTKENVNSNTQEKTNSKIDRPNNKLNEENKKQEYINKLDNIELGFKDFNNTEKTAEDMMNHANERYKQWNAALDEIYYDILKGQSSPSEIENLQNEEIQWTDKRDAKAEEDSSKMKGGTMESILYTNSLAQSTKERCYELVDKYMK
ncbi:DUF1311 domain-containing protein [Clostridium sp. HV4-5-A1G]|nr:DUF1311 domain-containing protein [Clostridium sp. HV4-5-A1G]